MIASIILQLTAKENGRIHGSTGRAVHGFWYQQWQNVAPPIAQALHGTSGPQPFTLSPLMGLRSSRQGAHPVQQGDKVWLRLTTLHAEITQLTLETWLPLLPDSLTLADIPWHLHNIALMPQEHPHATQTSYQALQQQAAPANAWKFTFLTPTTFHVGQKAYMPFPLPGALVNSWWQRWHAFAPQPLPPLDFDLIREQLFVSQYQLETVPVRHGPRLAVGCVGSLTLKAGKLGPDICCILTTLARYATYCGSGKHTTQGMGMTNENRGTIRQPQRVNRNGLVTKNP